MSLSPRGTVITIPREVEIKVHGEHKGVWALLEKLDGQFADGQQTTTPQTRPSKPLDSIHSEHFSTENNTSKLVRNPITMEDTSRLSPYEVSHCPIFSPGTRLILYTVCPPAHICQYVWSSLGGMCPEAHI